jgi:uncharacterized membrane protein YgaE (UPF0421/DUF939 family)
MKFFHRFAYYLVGLVVGIFFVSLIFSGKIRAVIIFQMRVLNDIRNKPFDYSEKASKY